VLGSLRKKRREFVCTYFANRGGGKTRIGVRYGGRKKREGEISFMRRKRGEKEKASYGDVLIM